MALLLAACSGPAPSATPTPTLAVVSTPATTVTAAPPDTPALTSTPSATAPPPRAAQLTICLASEPQSLYRYARPEAGRDHILAALYDGPIDQTGADADYGFVPVLLTALPKPSSGDAVRQTTSVAPGELVVDALDRVVPLAEGVRLLDATGTVWTYSGDQPADLPQWIITFHLKPGLTWSDGAPLTAADFVFAYTLGGDVDSQDPLRAVAERTTSYLATDDLTVVWTGLPGYLDPLYFTHFWPPLPQHQFEGLTPGQIADSEAAMRAPMGWGPFVIEQWTPGEQLTLTRNLKYWRAAEGLPRVERLVYRFVPDATALLTALKAGACDIAPSAPGLTALADSATAVGVTAQVVAGPNLAMLHFNLLPPPDYAPYVDARIDPPYADLELGRAEVRQALAQCFDRGLMAPVRALAAGDSYQRGTLLAGSRYPWDPTGAVERLDALGLYRPQVTFSLAYGPRDNVDVRAVMQWVTKQIQGNCGAAYDSIPMSLGEVLGDWDDSPLFGRRYGLAIATWRVGPVPPCALFITDQIASADNPGGANVSGYANPAFDAACRQAQVADDAASAAPAQAQAAELFAQDLPALPLFWWPRSGLARASVTGYVVDGLSDSELWNIEEIVP